MLGVCSLHPQAGISVPNLEEAHVKRAMIPAAPYIVEPLSELTHLVTERSVPEDALVPYQALDVTVV